MPTQRQIQEQIDALQAQLDTADTDDEVWIKDDKGREIKVSGRRATAVLGKFSDLWQDNAPEGESGEGDGEPEADPGPEAGYFGRRRK